MSVETRTAGRIALGTAQFGLDYGVANERGRVPEQEVRQILSAGLRAGMDTLDTAVAYGESEETLGRCGVAGWKIVTKIPAIPEHEDHVGEWLHATVTSSLERLGVKKVYGVQLHRPAEVLGHRGSDLAGGLQRVKAEGLVEKIGFSVYDPAELTDLLGRLPVDLVQAPFNVLDRRLIESGWMEKLSAIGVEVHVRSVFLQGLLVLRARSLPDRFARWRQAWGKWEQWLEQERLSALEACLRFALSFPGVSRAVVGVDSAAQLHQVITAANGPAILIPDSFGCGDLDLLDPRRWSTL
ncbi:MAG: aldo/keto reductase [Thermoanaerobaculaceae bacterium]